MKKIKNKFIIGVISLIIFILSFQLYKYSNFNNPNIDSYAILIEGKGKINNDVLFQNEKKKINAGDTIKTTGIESILVIEWGDGSITRLGGNTSIIVNENNISKDLTQINISFNLLNGKSWSNVINFMGQNSHFKEYFNDIEAGVRGTVFDVNLEQNYIYVRDHEVSLKTTKGKVYKIGENKPFSLKTFSFIDLRDFIINFKDKTWEKLNKQFDTELINKLKIELTNSIKNNETLKTLSKLDIKSLNLKEKEKAYNELLSKYQKFNFVKPSDEELFIQKMKIKSSLISLANKENKKALTETVIYDINSAINTQKEFLIKQFIPMIQEYKNMLPSIDLNNFNNLYNNINTFIDGNKDSIGNKVKGFINGTSQDIGGKINTLINTFKK